MVADVDVVVSRISEILAERYEPYAAERIALRIVESLEAGDTLPGGLRVVPISALEELAAVVRGRIQSGEG
ncbi:hypothetical protein [Aureimonas sp. AU12]|uniref:hypothetical protein n=1 Tax=Aureimonas sp. AU12 TaxID=1638161 RepID=UPI000782E6DD|nr:hypothetical protein [Aureimonas sp. AU12]